MFESILFKGHIAFFQKIKHWLGLSKLQLLCFNAIRLELVQKIMRLASKIILQLSVLVVVFQC